MKFYPENPKYKLNNELNDFLLIVRKIRNFSLKEYIVAKTNIIKSYFEESKLDTAVVAVSGGIDSAVVLAIMNYVKNVYPNIIKNIIPITLPLINEEGATNQEETVNKAHELCNFLNTLLYELQRR